jgi:hypothetical protein
MKSSVLEACGKCHQGDDGLPDMREWEGVKDHTEQIWFMINHGLMPPTSKGYDLLSKCKTAALRKWIDEGAKRNSTTTVADLPQCAEGIDQTPEPEPLPPR